MNRFTFAFALLLAACSSAAATPTLTPAPTAPTLTGSVDITYPLSDTAVYHELLTVSGTADVSGFALTLTLSDGQARTEVTIVPNESAWCVEIPHGYHGEPVVVRVAAVPLDRSGEYDAVTITLAGFEHRPDHLDRPPQC